MNLQHHHIATSSLMHSAYHYDPHLSSSPRLFTSSVSASGIDFVLILSCRVLSCPYNPANPVFEVIAHGVEQGQPSDASNNPRA